MKILSIDTCSNACTAAVAEDNKLITQMVINNKRTHSEKLMPMIEFMLSETEISLTDIDLIAVANGPGSFTGVRIGVATAQGLSHALGIPHIGISTLESLAANCYGFDGIICPILNARREQVYTGLFRWENGELARTCPNGQADTANPLDGLQKEYLKDCNIPLDELLEKLQNEKQIIFLGDGMFEFCAEIEQKLGKRAIFAPLQMNMNSAASVANRAFEHIRKNGEVPLDNVVIPNYLRLSQAERELADKQ